MDLSSSCDTVIFWETQQAGRPGQEEDQACEHVDPVFAYFTFNLLLDAKSLPSLI